MEEVIQGLLRRAPPVSSPEHLVQISLSVTQTAVDGLIQVLPLLGFGSTATVNTHELGTGPRGTI